MDYVSLAISFTITLFFYILYSITFNRTDTLRLIYKKTSKNHFILQKLRKSYKLPFWCKSTFLQIVYSLGELRSKKIRDRFVPYNEEDTVPCGISNNETLLHWRIYRDEQGEIIKKPVLIIFPGLTGNSEDSYLKTLIITLKDSFHVCVANRIGSGASNLKDYRLTFMSNWESIDRIVNFVYKKMNGDAPIHKAQMPLFAVGYSLGGHNLLKYLTKSQYQPFKLIAAVTLSQVFDIASNTYRVEKAHPYYTRILTGSLKRFVRKNEEIYRAYEKSEEGTQRKFSVERVYTARTIPEFDNYLVKVIHDMETVERDYYEPNSITIEDMLRINIPVFILHAEDDPVCTKEGIPTEIPLINDNIIIGTTTYGTHCGFIQGGVLIPNLSSYSDELCTQFFNSILDLSKYQSNN